MESKKLDLGRTCALFEEISHTMYGPCEKLEKCLTVIAEELEAERGFIMLYDSALEQLNVYAVRNLDPEIIFTTEEISLTIINRVFDTEKSAMSSSAVDDPRFKEKTSVILSGLRSFICVPISTDEGLLGILYLDDRSKKGAFEQKDLKFLSGCGKKLSEIILRFFPDIKPKQN